MIRHHLKSADAQGLSAVRSSSIAVVNGTAHMTVIPPLPIRHDQTAAEQAAAIFQEIERRLESVGSSKSRIAHITIWLSHLMYFQEVTEVWNEWVDPANPPVRACAQVNLANKNLKVEMIVVADAS
ncbi:enamine deaminase RidA (YjgF/YER057c/UK114 family) [Hoeflea marina]|uniref:Enamine deaminase RidA (YjgF/YER057c/UK114 family) n=1 Tax=Hoeflea marina TaxID=274592 RepID=A0A317PNZ1_9HYPH|nr:Rid family hydrolase [Hoeflea marina]PWW01929.1 enamine deaminase RidA (YjgF/YER057c/UK114 family) [Hoeflea marina]